MVLLYDTVQVHLRARVHLYGSYIGNYYRQDKYNGKTMNSLVYG